MKNALLLAVILLPLKLWAFMINPIPACGESDRDNPTLRWSTIATLSIDSPFMKDNALLCLGAAEDGKPVTVIYRDRRANNYLDVAELRTKRKVILHSDDIDVSIVRPGSLITLGIPQVNVQGEEQVFNLELRFMRNLAKFGHADRRAWRPALSYHHRLGVVRSIGDNKFDHLNFKITATAVIKTLGLYEGGKQTSELATSKFGEVDEL
jgi:hypothetical protein